MFILLWMQKHNKKCCFNHWIYSYYYSVTHTQLNNDHIYTLDFADDQLIIFGIHDEESQESYEN